MNEFILRAYMLNFTAKQELLSYSPQTAWIVTSNHTRSVIFNESKLNKELSLVCVA